MWYDSCVNHRKPKHNDKDDSLEIYEFMSFYISKILKIKPFEILDTWTPAEIIVTFGTYANEKSMEAHRLWEDNKDRKNRGKEPQKYIVKFIGKIYG